MKIIATGNKYVPVRVSAHIGKKLDYFLLLLENSFTWIISIYELENMFETRKKDQISMTDFQ